MLIDRLHNIVDKLNSLTPLNLYRNSGRLLRKLNYQYDQSESYLEISKTQENIEELFTSIHSSRQKLTKLQLELVGSGIDTSLVTSILEVLNEIENTEEKVDFLRRIYRDHAKDIEGLEDYLKTIETTDSELRTHIEKEAFDKATDLKHKMTLTLLRVVQIPVFILVTYFSINLAVQLIGVKDLVIPRGLISIVPSSLEQNAQNLANNQKVTNNISTMPEAAKNTKSVKNSVTSAHLKTPPQ